MKEKLVKELLNKVQADYRLTAENFDHTRQRQWNEMNDVLEYINDGDRILDWGCGNGRFHELLKDRNIDYLGIDNCKPLIEIAQEKYPDTKWQMTSELPDNKFNVITAFASWHHLPSKKLRTAKLIEFYNHLERDGLLILTTWNLKQKKYLWLWGKNNFRNIFTDYEWNDILVPWKAEDRPIKRYYHDYCQSTLKMEFSQVGFQVKECYYSDKGEHVNWWKGKNLIIIAKK